MLRIDQTWQVSGVTVYGDDKKFNLFYLLPEQPRYKRNPDGSLAFKYIKYRQAIDRPDGLRGGYVMFDVELTVDESLMLPIMEELNQRVQQDPRSSNIDPPPAAEIGTITYVDGETQVFVMGPESMVGPVKHPGSPSLYGKNITTVSIELSEEGATLFEQAMQGQGGSVSVAYNLLFKAMLPPVTVNAWWSASTFYSFYQTIDTDWSLWGEDDYRETVREMMISSESMNVEIDFGMQTDPEIQLAVSNWAYNTLEAAVERKMIEAVAPVPDDQRNAPDGIEDVTRDISNTRISSVNISRTDKYPVDWKAVPQGQLQNITSLDDGTGSLIRWEDYASIIDLDDPFFRQLRVNVFVNANFDDLPIHSVEVLVMYNGRPMPNMAEGEPEGEVMLNSPDAVGKFATYVENDNWKYTYSYQVNFTGETKIYQSPDIDTNEGNLTINVDGLGILQVAVSAGSVDWNEVERAAVVFRYADSGAGVSPIEEQFQLTEASQTHQIQRVIFAPMRKNYTYQVTYFMKDGREYQGEEISGRSENLFIHDTFGARKTVSVRSVGDFVNKINTIFVDLEYRDEENDFTQTRSQALSASSNFFDWSFPVISESAGQVTYSATISKKDGSTDVIEKTILDSDTLLLPPAVESFLEVDVVTSLVDWNQVRLSHVALEYDDPDQNVSESQDYFLSATNKENQHWKVEQKDKSADEYSYTVVYYFANGGGQKTIGPERTENSALILDPGA